MVCLFTTVFETAGQCPVDEADLVDGGTFSGNCTVNVGGTATITGTVIWNGGTLNIEGSNGSLYIAGGLYVNSGDVLINDGNSGRLDVESGGVLDIAAGTSVTAWANINIWGTLVCDGELTSEDSRLQVYTGGTATVSSTGTLSTFGTGDNVISGDLTVEGTLNTAGDLEIDGGTVTVNSGGDLNLGDDLVVYGGGSLVVDDGASLDVAEDVLIGDDESGSGAGAGVVTIDGDFSVGDDLTVIDTTPDSGLLGTGDLSVIGDFNDNECPYSGTDNFCECNGISNCTVLPVVLLDFYLQETNQSVQLTWVTSMEYNNDFFTVERASENLNFKKIYTVKGNNGEGVRRYHFTDNTPDVGKNYYRLSQTDYDGTLTYFDIRSVDVVPRVNDFVAYPNVVDMTDDQVITFKLPPSEVSERTINIYDSRGLYLTKYDIKEKGNSLQVKLEELGLSESGVYLMRLSNDFGKYQQKILVK